MEWPKLLIKHQIALYHQSSDGQKLQHHSNNNIEEQQELLQPKDTTKSYTNDKEEMKRIQMMPKLYTNEQMKRIKLQHDSNNNIKEQQELSQPKRLDEIMHG